MKYRISQTAIATLLAATLASPVWAGQIACTITSASVISDGYVGPTDYTEPPTIISFTEAGVESVSSGYCEQVVNGWVRPEFIQVQCLIPSLGGEISMSADRMSGAFNKVIYLGGIQPPMGITATGTCATATQRF